RLAQTDDAAFIILLADVHVNHDVADIRDAGQFVELHIGVQGSAGLGVDDALLEERRADAHDDRAVDLAFGQAGVDHHSAISDRYIPVYFDHAGFGVDVDVDDLHAGGAAGDHPY